MENIIVLVLLVMCIIGLLLFWKPKIDDTSNLPEIKNAHLGQYPYDGHEFEYWVAAVLRGYGWKATVTQGSGDQGIDVIAEKSGYVFGIQCKRVSKPCGNGAVQQVLAGGTFYGIENLAVISTAGFTNSAQQLADKAKNCFLLTNFEIPHLNDLVGEHSSDAPDSILGDEEIIVKFNTPSRQILGRCVSTVAWSTAELGDLLRSKINANIDPLTGAGELSVTKIELWGILAFSGNNLTSKVKISDPNTNFDAPPKKIGKDAYMYSRKQSLSFEAIEEMKIQPYGIEYYKLFPADEVVEMQLFMTDLFRKCQNEGIEVPTIPFLTRKLK